MFIKYLLIFMTCIALVSLNGCSSSDEESTDENQTTSTESSDESSSSDTVSNSDEAAPVDEEEVVDEYPDDDYGGNKVAGADSSAEQIPDAPLESNQEETLFVGSEGTSTDSSETSTTKEVAETSDETPSVQTEPSVKVSDSTSEAKAWIPVRKMKKTPYKDSGALINRLYVARSGDTMNSVAQKIYGNEGKSKELMRWNPHFRGKSLNVGDKIYYASARNPADDGQIQLYYEEAGIQPQMYTASKNESIRKVSQKLLGHPRSWMEVWATNDVESKWDLAAGTQLRYWPDGTNVPVVTAQTAPQQQAPEEPAAVAAAEPMPEEDLSQTPLPNTEAAMDEPQLDEPQQVASVSASTPPPPPQQEPVAPPPPPPQQQMVPPPTPAPAGDSLASMMGGQDDSMMMAVLGGLLILAAIILLVFIRRGRKKVKYS